MKTHWKFWTGVFFIWLIATGMDRLWWQHQTGLPAWDQADYLNSALDHGRALGLLTGGGWQGWKALLDLSPKIPPLASIINGSVIAIAGDAPEQAAWSLSLWHGILLISVAGWGLQLRNEVLGLLAASLVAITPALLQLRSDYVLEMPLAAGVTLALWQLGNWLHPHQGGHWRQALIAALTCSIALLIKQSALLVLLPAAVWASAMALRRSNKSQLQLIAGAGIVTLSVFPWLRHNWITTLGGTNRAVMEAAVKEGDPSIFTLENWNWYPRILSDQIGPIILIFGISGCVLWILLKHSIYNTSQKNKDNKEGWKWLIISFILGWFLTSLLPNKDARYIAPLIPPLILLCARGWLEWGIWWQHFWPSKSPNKLMLFVSLGFTAALPTAWQSQVSLLKKNHQGPLKEIIQEVIVASPQESKITMIVVPSTPDLNQHNVSYFGRRQGGQLVGRQLGTSRNDVKPVLAHSQWIVLAEGDQGSVSESAPFLDKAIRSSGVFKLVRQFPRLEGGSYSLWHRQPKARQKRNFAKTFPKLAKGLQKGPKGFEPIFAEVALEHMLDGHFKYIDPVRKTALEKLSNNPKDIEAHWSLALLAILANRPYEASKELSTLEELLPQSPWPSAYRSIVLLAGWNPWEAAVVADKAQQIHNNPILAGLGDLSGVMGGALWRLPAAKASIPQAIRAVDTALQKTRKN